MAALTAPRNTPRLGGDINPYDFPLKANSVIHAGALVAVDASGYLVAGAASTTLKAAGRARSSANNTGGASGALTIAVDSGVFRWNNSSAGDAITIADMGADCYIVDDQTVAKTDGSSARSVAGKIVGIDAVGVWVSTKWAG